MADLPGTAAHQSGSARQPALLDSGDYARYLLHGKRDIVSTLHSLQDSVCQITAFFNEGQDLLLTTVIFVDEDRVLLDFGASPEINRKALLAEKLFCVASHEKVRIQFLLRDLKETSFEGRPAFEAALPAEVLRLQRREFFRLTTPVARPIRCVIPLADAEGNTQSLNVNVVDISGGGLAMAMPDDFNFEIGAEFPGCRIDLPEVGTVTATLQVRNQFEITLRSGNRVKRAGCEFIQLPGPMMTLIQRYIMKVERERKARDSGLL